VDQYIFTEGRSSYLY